MPEDGTATLEARAGLLGDAPPKRKGMKRRYVALLVGGIMAAEGLLGWWVLSNRSSAVSSQGSGAGTGEDPLANSKSETGSEVELTEPEDLEVQEVEIGEFQLTNYSLSGATMHLQFHFNATIEKSENEEFVKLFEEHKSRIRQRILSVLRSSSQEDLADPSLGAIRRKIQDDLNKQLERKLILSVFFTDAHVMPQ